MFLQWEKAMCSDAQPSQVNKNRRRFFTMACVRGDRGDGVLERSFWWTEREECSTLKTKRNK